ncbi:MAG: ABC-type uncharacterized transport system permease subunit [Planctomycetota bacterium]|jgi:ABC-type uncharacterized transport system permease subunit
MNAEPTEKQLELFGVILSAVISFWLLVYWFKSEKSLINLWPYWLVMVLLLSIAMIMPLRLKIFYLKWMKAAELINKIVVNFMLCVIFFLLITPIAFIKRILGDDPLRKPHYIEGTYRQQSNFIKPEDMENPF